MDKPKKLTPKQRKFAKEYQKDLNATQAAKRAGYSKKTAKEIASQNLTKPAIKETIAKDIEKRAEKLGLDADWVLKRVMDIADVDLSGAYDHIGQLKPVHDIPENIRKSLTGIKVFDEFSGFGNEKFKIGEVRELKFADKVKALELLGRHLKLFTDKIEHSGDKENPIAVTAIDLDSRVKQIKGEKE